MRRFSLLLLGSVMSFAADYSVREVVIDGIAAVVLSDPARRTEVTIVPSLGNLAYEMKVNGKNVFWTDKPLGELKTRPSLCGNPFLAPWANRLDGEAFYANGKKYRLNMDLGNVGRDGNRNPIHGLLAFSPLWKVVKAGSNGGAAQVTSRLEFWRYPDLMAQFPFAHTIEMTYRLAEGRLEVETALENHSAEPMPVAVGFHPYFQIHDAPRDRWKVHLAARERFVLSRLLIPTGERKPIDLPDPVPLEGRQLDDVFGGLTPNAEFRVQGDKERISVIYGPKYTVAVVYAPAGRNFICFEPMSAVTNAFNLAHAGLYTELQTVPPGGVWRESYWIAPSGF